MVKSFHLIMVLFSVISIQIHAYEETGTASWYGPNFHGKLTANGEKYNQEDYTAAHKTLPLGSIVKVSSLENNKSVYVRVNDRGPFVKGRIIDLSYKAAYELDMISTGTMKVTVTLVEEGDNSYHRYSTRVYTIQLGSFRDEEKAGLFLKNIRDKGFPVKMERVLINNEFYYRVIIPDCNYAEVQLYRVQFAREGIENYLIK